MIWGALFLLVSALWWLYHKSHYHFRVVERGRFYCSGTLTRKTHQRMALKKICHQYGINTIINLRSVEERDCGDWYTREKEFCHRQGIELIDIPMNVDTPPNEQQIQQFVRMINEPKRVFLMHCEAGVIRTNMMVAIYMKHRWQLSGNETIQKLNFYGHSIDKPSRSLVKAFILNYQPVNV